MFAQYVSSLFSKIRGISSNYGKILVVAVPFFWVLVLFVVPFVMVFGLSFTQSQFQIPPFQSLFQREGDYFSINFYLGNFRFLFQDPLYLKALINSLKLAGTATVFCLLLGYPVAYAISRTDPAWRLRLLILVILPMWTSYLMRVYAWMYMLNTNGIINNFLLKIGMINQPLPLMDNAFAVCVGLVYCYLPFMVIPIYTSLEKQNPAFLEAASDLGCPPWQSFLKITLPLSFPGIVGGTMLVFIPCIGEFVIPELLGGTHTLMMGKLVWMEFFHARDWPMAATISSLMLGFLLIPLILLQRLQAKVQVRSD